MKNLLAELKEESIANIGNQTGSSFNEEDLHFFMEESQSCLKEIKEKVEKKEIIEMP